jgi:hypothetical protein
LRIGKRVDRSREKKRMERNAGGWDLTIAYKS